MSAHQWPSTTSHPLEAAVFDLDGVLTHTARLHFAAWKQLFDELLRRRSETAAANGFRPFEEVDYRTWVDGRPRFDGLRAFLAARGIGVPEGSQDDPPDAETIHGLARRKQQLFSALLHRHGVDVEPGAVALCRALHAAGVAVGMASSSKNAKMILRRAGMDALFDAEVDGLLSERLHLRGKPAPDIFLACLDRLGPMPPAHAAVFEDAAVGIQAGRAGGFGLVIGVNARGNSRRLCAAGADRVVASLEEVSVERLREWMVRDG